MVTRWCSTLLVPVLTIVMIQPRACPAVACKGDYASAALAWIGVWLEDPEPTLLNWEALHILRDQGMYRPGLYWGPAHGGCCPKIEGCGFIWTAAGIV
ncbi:hypothetical protein Tco_0664386 [Tanacetum coccineum]